MLRGQAGARLVLALAAALLAAGCGDDNPEIPDAGLPDGVTPGDGGGGDGGGDWDGGNGDGAPSYDAMMQMSIFEILPPAASREVDTTLTVTGNLLKDGATFQLVNCDTSAEIDLTPVTVAADGRSLSALLPQDPTRPQGLYSVIVTNPDGQSDRLECAFRVLASLPPTVTDVTPTTAYRGNPADGVLSDVMVSIRGTGFVSTPVVRWIKADAPDAGTAFDALTVGFVSDTHISAVVPSETLHMPVGIYHVWVVNPDQLGARWMVSDGAGGTQPGEFTITDNPPPDITDIDPVRIENGTCTSTQWTITGSGFAVGPDATVWYIAAPGASCAGSRTDANGNTLCPVTVDSIAAGGDSILAHFASCPGQGPWPIVVINPDDQADYFYSLTVTSSADGHLNNGKWTYLDPLGNPVFPLLLTARWRHAANFAFDAFGHAFLYVAGGQSADGTVLNDVEVSEVNIFGNPGPFAIGQQWQDVSNPRVPNNLVAARAGATLVRAGHDLFLIGGAASRSDISTTVAATTTVQRARVLSYDEMPTAHRPQHEGGGDLPTGSWYYRVSALGPWGESLASREVVGQALGGSVKVCWEAPVAAGVTGWNVYRSLASDGRAGTTVLLATVNDPATTCFIDDGAEALAPAPGNLRGDEATGTGLVAGYYTYRVSAELGSGIETLAGYPVTVRVVAAQGAVSLAWDPIPNAVKYHLYRCDAATSLPCPTTLLLDTGDLTATTYLDDGAAAGTDGPLVGYRPLRPGSLSLWSTAGVPELLTAREGLDGVFVAMKEDVTTPFLLGRVIVAGGRSVNDSTAGYLKTAESLGVWSDGSLGWSDGTNFHAEWQAETPQFVVARAFYALLTTQDRNTTPFPPPPVEPPCTTDMDSDTYISEAVCGGDDCCDDGTETATLGCDPSTAPGIHPGAVEICDNGIDEDCDGVDPPCTCTTDVDADGYISEAECGGPDCCDDGTETGTMGCDPTTAPDINPGAIEICGNGIDEDCDGVDPPCTCNTDADGDGYVSLVCGGADCCDTGADTSLGCTDTTAAGIHPGATEICGNGIDEDCDGFDGVCKRAGGAGAVPVPYDLDADESVYLVAVMGDDTYVQSGNAGTSSLEACEVGPDGHLVNSWVVQAVATVHDSFGLDAVLYFNYLFAFFGVQSETVTPTGSSRSIIGSSINRFTVKSPLIPDDAANILGSRQSASTSFEVGRAYYQMVRLMSYVYVVGGIDNSGNPLGSIERHEQ